MCSPVYTNYVPPMVWFTPNDYIPVYYKKLRLWLNFPEGTIDHIYIMADEIMKKDKILSKKEKRSSLKEEKPQTVAAAIIVYYMGTHNIVLDKDYYKTIFKKSEMTINKIKNRIIKAHNE